MIRWAGRVARELVIEVCTFWLITVPRWVWVLRQTENRVSGETLRRYW